MTKVMLLPCLALLAAASPGSSNAPPIAPQIAATDEQQAPATAIGGRVGSKPANDQNKKICKQLPTSGSRLPNRACLTAKEWQQLDDELSH